MSPRGTEGRFRVWALVRAWPSNAVHLWRGSLRIRVVTAIVVLLGQELNFQGEVVLSIAGAAIIAFTLYLLLRPRAKVIHARRVSEA